MSIASFTNFCALHLSIPIRSHCYYEPVVRVPMPDPSIVSSQGRLFQDGVQGAKMWATRCWRGLLEVGHFVTSRQAVNLRREHIQLQPLLRHAAGPRQPSHRVWNMRPASSIPHTGSLFCQDPPVHQIDDLLADVHSLDGLYAVILCSNVYTAG